MIRLAGGFTFAKTGEGRDRAGRAVECVATKATSKDPTQKAYVDAVRDFLKTKGIEQPKVKIESILRVDLTVMAKRKS